MLQRLLQIRLDTKIASRPTNLLLRIPVKSQSCNQCKFRLISSRKDVNYYEKSSFSKARILWIKPRYFSTQVDAEKKNDVVDCVKDKSLKTSKKINVKLKTSELRRLITLAEPEKWTLAGAISFLVVSSSVTMAVPFSLGKVLDIIYSSSSDLGAAREQLDTLLLTYSLLKHTICLV